MSTATLASATDDPARHEELVRRQQRLITVALVPVPNYAGDGRPAPAFFSPPAIAMIDLRSLAYGRYRITTDPSAALDTSRESRPWYERIPCKYGFIGVHGVGRLMAHCWSRRIATRLLALDGITARQAGDDEVNVTFPPDRLPAVAEVLGARRKRRLSDQEKARLVERLKSPRGRGFPGAPSDARVMV